MADARKTLPHLRSEWASCTACDLGPRRINNEGQLVFGEGVSRGIMFIGEGPAEKEEEIGRPFAGPSGLFLRKALLKLGMADEVYLTHVVCCRSCSAMMKDGQPVFRKNYKSGGPATMMFKDELPTPLQWQACLPRLYEEIYIVDPILIVGMGSTVCNALTQRHFPLTKKQGEPTSIFIPGAAHIPVLTEKKQEWVRKKNGALERPVERNQVEYLFLPTIHPGAVLAKGADEHKNSNFNKFMTDLVQARLLYNEYMSLAMNIDLEERKSISMESLYEMMNTEEP